MPADRPPIPRPLEREVLVEAGHRCAIPTCRTVPVELAHIAPWSKVKNHTFDNLIALCPTCHTRYDNGDIDRLAMRQYKANLAILTSRYRELERRVLEALAPAGPDESLVLPGSMTIMVWYLLTDGLITEVPMSMTVQIQGIDANKAYQLTPEGRAFVNRWQAAEKL